MLLFLDHNGDIDVIYFLEAGAVNYNDCFLLINENTYDDGNENGDSTVWIIPEHQLTPSCSSIYERLKPKDTQGKCFSKQGWTQTRWVNITPYTDIWGG